MIAALYVQTGGCYFGLPEVDPWDEQRDARLYAGPFPVVAHPPCERWGKYWYGGAICHRNGTRKIKGDDGGCFAAALAAVRTYGGVLEHPRDSAAWRAHGLLTPPYHGGWVAAGDNIGWTCCVDQGHYGHRAAKGTWLYAAGISTLPSLTWGRSAARAHVSEMSRSYLAKRRSPAPVEFLGKRERAATPPAFRDLLLSIARSAVGVAKGRARA